jgi:hypothetical protein
MENIKGTSIVDTKEYLALLEFQEAMQKEFVIFTFGCEYKKIYAYSKDKFLDKYEEGNKSISKRLEIQNERYYKMSNDLHETRLKLMDTEAKLEKASKFSLPSFLIGFFTLLATYSTIMLLIKYFKW